MLNFPDSPSNGQSFTGPNGVFTWDGSKWAPGTSATMFANPTAQVGTSAVNGSATSAMRSDAAPALSQAIVPTWTGLHDFTGGAKLKGTTTNDNAPTGYVGELVTLASGTIALSATFTPTDLGVITLTAGDWDIWATYYFTGTSTTTVTVLIGAIGGTSPSYNLYGEVDMPTYGQAVFVYANPTVKVGLFPVKLATTTSIHMWAWAGYSTSTCSVQGTIYARRRR
jgi:hypothetical protein